MVTDNGSAREASTLDDSNVSGPDSSTASVTKSKGSKPSVDEIRKRAYEFFRSRHDEPGSALQDWQKAEASTSADAAKTDTPETNGAKADSSKAVVSKTDAAKEDPPKGVGAKADGSKDAQIPKSTETIEEAVTKSE